MVFIICSNCRKIFSSNRVIIHHGLCDNCYRLYSNTSTTTNSTLLDMALYNPSEKYNEVPKNRNLGNDYGSSSRNRSTNISETIPFGNEEGIEGIGRSSTPILFPNHDDIENSDPNVPNSNDLDDDLGVDDHIADGVDENFLSSFNEEKKESVVFNRKMEEKRDYLRRKLDRSKRFYYDANDQLALNRQSFLRYSGIPTFEVGYAWKNRVDRMDKIELMAQLVNEITQIRNCCLQLYYRESSCCVSKKRRERLISKYIGKTHENQFKEVIEKEVKEFVWFLEVYKKRYLDVKNRLVRTLGLEDDFLKSIKSYEDVYDYFIYHLENKDIEIM